MSMFLTIIFGFLLLDLLWWRLAAVRVRRLPRANLWRTALAIFVLPLLAYLLLMAFWPVPIRHSGGMPTIAHIFIYLWHFIALPLTLLVWAVSAIRNRRKAARFELIPVPSPVYSRGRDREGAFASEEIGDGKVPSPQPSPGVPEDGVQRVAAQGSSAPAFTRPLSSRRQILAAVAIPPLATSIVSAWSMQSLYARRLTKIQLTIPQLPRQLDGMTIAHVSDTHIGKFLHPSRLPAIADDINKLDADFIAFTGDLIDLSLDDLPYGIDFLRRLKSRCGMVICEGNHDIMQHRGDFEYAMRDADLPIILGDQLTLRYVSRNNGHFPVQFLAVPWNPHEAEMAEAVNIIKPSINPGVFPILLAHHPHSFDAAAAAGFPLILSGHTHGGQIMMTSQFGLGSLRFRYTSGLYQKPGSSLFVNNGLGNWFPLRINAPAELVHITLKRV